MKLIVIGSICILSVMTVGYAAFGTSLNISAKGNIVKNETTSETIKNEQCNASSNDGLYKDTNEEGRCIYRGSNPNNYITFNGEEAGWRIISIENDGTMKIMKRVSIGDRRFDDTDVRLQGESGYCNAWNCGCNVWGSASTMLDASGNKITSMPHKVNETETYPLPAEESKMTQYLNNDYYGTLSEEAKEQIGNHLWNAGLLNDAVVNPSQTLEISVSQEKAYKWRGKVGLINITDYARASTDTSCITIKNSIDTRCENNNYLYNSSYNWWTMTPLSVGGTSILWSVNLNGKITHFVANDSKSILPSVFLKSDINLDGSGTEDDPYTIK